MAMDDPTLRAKLDAAEAIAARIAGRLLTSESLQQQAAGKRIATCILCDRTEAPPRCDQCGLGVNGHP